MNICISVLIHNDNDKCISEPYSKYNNNYNKYLSTSTKTQNYKCNQP